MQILESAPINFLCFSVETTLDKLEKYLPVGQELFVEAVQHHLPITGPVHWHYYNFNGNPQATFSLEVCLPIGKIPVDYDGRFQIKRTDNFKCVSELHSGNWLEMPTTYGEIIKFINDNGLTPLAQSREVYVNVDFGNPLANQTIVQVGVK